MKETDLFQPVKELFESQGFTVYSEVEGPQGRADIVAVRGPELVVCELKVTLSLDLMEQGFHWKNYANRVYVAVPQPKQAVNRFAQHVLHKEGIGLILVDFGRHYVKDTPIADIQHRPRAAFTRKILPYLRNALKEEQRNGPPGGSASGGYVTTYKLTMDRVKSFLHHYMSGEWATVAEILEHCETHYATPKNSLAKALLSFEAKWCESKKEGGRMYFRYKAAAPQGKES